MHVLRVEHPVSDYDDWKKAFDNDPIGRRKLGVVRYRILRAADDPNYVMIDLEFEGANEADRMHNALRELWGQVDVIRDPQTRTAELLETKEY
jgi:hypothetical protein